MSFFQPGRHSAPATAAGYRLDFLWQSECAICPLNHADFCHHPKMKPHGSRPARVYVLGEAPGEQEDLRGKFFVGPSGKLLKRYLPDELQDEIRWGNVIRCFPGKGATPGPIETEACRPSIIRDIEACKPKAIFGFGNIALNWAIGETGITKWCGRRIPVKIGSHVCWYYAFIHPAAILHNKPEYHPGPYSSEDEFAMAFQLRQAIKELDHLPEPKVHSTEEALAGIDIITGVRGDEDLDRVHDFLRRELRDEPVVGYDYETNAIRPYRDHAKILSVALAGSRRSLGIALLHRQTQWTGPQRKRLGQMLRQFLLNGSGRRLASHQAAFEIEWSAHWFGEEVIWGTNWEDTASQAYILDERPWTLSLEFVVRQYFGFSIKGINNLDRDHLDDAELPDVLRYNALDAKYHRLAFLVQEQRLKKEGLLKVYRHQLERTIAVVPMQLQGVPVDAKMNRYLQGRYEKRLHKIEGTIESSREGQLYRRLTGATFRPSSLDDVRRYLVVVLGRNEFKSKEFKVDEATLGQVNDPLIKLVRRWRKVNKILSTYILPVRHDSEHVYPDGYMHPIVSTTKTRTWRTSGSDPNTQNWPKRDPVAVEARTQIFRPDYRIVAFDFAGIQARNVAMESQDKRLIKYFHERYDIHTDWMKRLAILDPRWASGGVRALEKDKDLFKRHRYMSKNKFVFPSFFGARPKSISRALGVALEIAEKLQRAFWREFPDIKGWQEELVKSYYRKGYVTGLSGFRRHAPVIHNELINSPIQSDESLIVCDAMVRISKLGLPCTMEIHDDLTFVWPKNKIDEYAELVVTEMLRVVFPWINVPLEIEMSVGEDWGTMEEVGKFESVGKDQWRELPK